MQQDSAEIRVAENTIRYTEFILSQLLNEPDSLKSFQKFEVLNPKT
jgi:hypothetical protein